MHRNTRSAHVVNEKPIRSASCATCTLSSMHAVVVLVTDVAVEEVIDEVVVVVDVVVVVIVVVV